MTLFGFKYNIFNILKYNDSQRGVLTVPQNLYNLEVNLQ